MKSRLLCVLGACAFFYFPGSANAALETIILDTTLDIYWAGDGNFLARDELRATESRVDEIITAVGSIDGHILTTDDFAKSGPEDFYNGTMTWWGAMAWADQLVYGGFDDWRLPSMDVNGDGVVVNCDVVSEEGCRDNEYGYLFEYDGITAANPDPFTNVEGRNWSLTESGTDRAWFFSFFNTTGADHAMNTDLKSNTHFALAVRDATVVPIPPAVYLFASGLIGLTVMARRKSVKKASVSSSDKTLARCWIKEKTLSNHGHIKT